MSVPVFMPDVHGRTYDRVLSSVADIHVVQDAACMEGRAWERRAWHNAVHSALRREHVSQLDALTGC